MRGKEILEAAESCRSLLEPAVEADWRVPVPGLDWTVAEAVAHAANAPLWYAVDLWSGPADNAAFDVTVKSDGGNSALIVSMLSAARVCAACVDAAPEGTRGFHPVGSPDPSGFAAMACDELLVHTDDAARGLGLPFRPSLSLSARVLARLFPWHVAGDDPWRTLLWANGRIELPDLPDQQGWRWHCRPLSEWDGQRPYP